MFERYTVLENDAGVECQVQVAESEMPMPRHELNQRRGFVEIPAEAALEEERIGWQFENLKDARAAWGLWDECGPFQIPEDDDLVPATVATSGRAYLCAYFYLGFGRHGACSRGRAAERLDISKATVSNHLSTVRVSI